MRWAKIMLTFLMIRIIKKVDKFAPIPHLGHISPPFYRYFRSDKSNSDFCISC